MGKKAQSSLTRLHYWQIKCLLPGGTTQNTGGIAAHSETACVLARKAMAKAWSLEPEDIEILEFKQAGPVNFGA